MEDVLAKGDREVLETVADCMHNMPEVGMAEPKYRDLSTFGEEVRQIRSVYNGQCFVGYVDRLMQPIPKKKSFLPDLCCCVVAIAVIAGLVLWAVHTFAQRKIDRKAVTSYGEAFVEYIFAGDFAAADACMEMKETADVQMLFDIAEEKWGLDFQSGMCVQGISSYTDSLSDAQWGVPAAYFTMVLTEGERPVSVQLNVIERENVFSVTYITIRCGVETLGYGGNEDAEDFRSEAFVSHETEEFL
jgi:hypothetical protein